MSVGYLWQPVEKVVLVVSSCGAEVEEIVVYKRDIQLVEYNFHICTMQLDDIKVLFSHQYMH